jgi:phosphoribosylformylglycinamidine cyclo-ligase
VGAVERKQMLTGAGIRAGDVLLGLPSNGLHTNGYSLARKLLFDTARHSLTEPLADELLKVHRSYLKPIRALIDARMLKGAAHITGGGITDNTPRILPQGLAARVDVSSWTIPPFFEELRAIGNLDLADYRRTFNLGVGMILVIAKRNLGKARALLSALGEACFQMGEVVESRGPRVEYV